MIQVIYSEFAQNKNITADQQKVHLTNVRLHDIMNHSALCSQHPPTKYTNNCTTNTQMRITSHNQSFSLFLVHEAMPLYQLHDEYSYETGKNPSPVKRTLYPSFHFNSKQKITKSKTINVRVCRFS